MTQNSNESQIRALVKKWAGAVRAKDMEGVLANHTDDIVMFDVPMPLQSKGMKEYRKTWELFFDHSPGGPGSFDITELRIEASESVAYCHALVKIFDSKVRVTIGLRKEKGQWLIAHEHHSYPIELDSGSPNVSVVRRLYEARGNPEVIRQVLASDVRWEVVDGFPYGAVYVGLDSVLRDFFGRLFADFDEFVANGSEFFESGERVIALGSYSGRARRTGKRFSARFAHVWTLRNGLIVRLQQCADTVQLARALAD